MKQTNYKITILLLIIISSLSYAVKGEGGQQKQILLKRVHRQSIDKKNLRLQLPPQLPEKTKNELQQLLVSLKNPSQSIECEKTISKILESESQVSSQLVQLPVELQEEAKKSFIEILESYKSKETHPVESFKEHTLKQSMFIFLYMKNPLAEIADPRFLAIFHTLDDDTKKDLVEYKRGKIFKKIKTT